MNRKKLAANLLNYESQAHDQIPLLLKMNEIELALQKAALSDDIDLIYYTIIMIENKIKSNDQYFKIISYYPEIFNLLKIYYQYKITSNDCTLLHSLLIYNKLYLDAGHTILLHSYLQIDYINKINLLKESLLLYNQHKDGQSYRILIDEHINLLDLQLRYDKRSNSKISFQGLNVISTIQLLICLGLDDIVDSRWIDAELPIFIKKFKVSDKSIYYIKLKIYAERNEWTLLHKLGTEKKPCIGYKPFAIICIQ